MRNIPAIVHREVSAYFLSPLGYLVIFAFLALAGFFFQVILWEMRQATLEPMFHIMGYLLLLLSPLITMRLLAEEVRLGTIEGLMTAPVTDAEVVLGKFAGAFIFYALLLLPTVVYVGVLAWLGRPDYGLIFSGYLGLLLMGGLCLSIGLLCSALTRSQVVAAVTALVALVFLFVVGALSGWLSGPLFDVLRYAGLAAHQEGFASGTVDTRDVVYYVSATVFFLFLSVRAVESRQWR